MERLYLRQILSRFTLPVIFSKIMELGKEPFPLVKISLGRLKDSIKLTINETATELAVTEPVKCPF